jgi:cytochrome c-type biogenesis protein
MPEVSVLLAFVYGILSFVSPCVLPLIPVYLANISGEAITQTRTRRWHAFTNSLFFVLGFTIMFSLWGAGAGLLGTTLATHLPTVRRVVGWALIAFGALMLISLKIPWLNFEARLRVQTGGKATFARSFVMGAIFPIAWTPCASWVLGSILLLAGTSESAGRGAVLLAVYSLGLGIPFLLLALGLDYLSPFLNKLKRFSTAFYIVSALLLIAVGSLLAADKLTWFLGRL